MFRSDLHVPLISPSWVLVPRLRSMFIPYQLVWNTDMITNAAVTPPQVSADALPLHFQCTPNPRAGTNTMTRLTSLMDPSGHLIPSPARRYNNFHVSPKLLVHNWVPVHP